MSLLEVITKASANGQNALAQSEFPIILNSDGIVPNLKPNAENPDKSLLVCPVTGWQISQIDAQVIDLSKKFYTKLKRKLKDTNSFGKDEFVGTLIQFLEKIAKLCRVSIEFDSSDSDYTRVLVEELGFKMGRDVAGLVLEACLIFEIWDLVEALIVEKIVDKSCYSNLFTTLLAKRRSDLVCECIIYATDLGLSELLCVLNYFLCPPKDAYSSMVSVRKEWESQALLAVEKTSDKKVSSVAKDASILLMVAYDEFSMPELCLHYLLASPSIDEMVLSSAICKLNGKEMMSLLRYLGKWLKKYDMFPQAGPCPKASSELGLENCDWVPKLEDIVRWLGLVLDENFSSLLLDPEFHEELKLIEGLVGSLASEARLCCSVANVVDNFRIGAQEKKN